MGRNVKLAITHDMLYGVWHAINNFDGLSRYIEKRHGNSKKYFSSSVYRLKQQGLIRVISKESKKFIELTEKGQLKVLLSKVKLEKDPAWDGKWRLIIFDIPEDAKIQRDKLRALLKKIEFKKLQASVYISPFALNRESIIYLKETRLIEFIRILRVDEMDYDADLKKKFNLK